MVVSATRVITVVMQKTPTQWVQKQLLYCFECSLQILELTMVGTDVAAGTKVCDGGRLAHPNTQGYYVNKMPWVLCEACIPPVLIL